MSISIEAHDRICQDLHQQIRSLIVENEKLRAALEQPEDPMREAKALAQAYENGWNAAQPLEQPEPRRTGLPHCERSCEANAFQIEIRRLTGEVRMLQEQNTELDRKLAELERNA